LTWENFPRIEASRNLLPSALCPEEKESDGMIAPPQRLVLMLAALLSAAALTGCADGAPGTPGTATARLNGSATFFAGVGGSH
jgi:hypothetical protein